MIRMNRLLKSIFFALFLAVWISGSGLANAAASAPKDLLGDYAGTSARDTAPDPTIMRSRMVSVNHRHLQAAKNEQGDVLPGQSIRLNLFPDADFTAVLDRVENNPSGSQSWVGHLKGVDMGQAVFVTDKGLTVGNISMPGAFYEVRYVDGDLHVVHQIDHAKFPAELEPLIPPAKADTAPSAPIAPAPGAQAMADTNSMSADNRTALNTTSPTVANFVTAISPSTIASTVVDVLVVYTPSAATAVGGASAMSALIDLAITESNAGYANSGITHRLRRVGSSQVTYTENSGGLSECTAMSCGFNTDLDNLTNGVGGLSGVAALRSQYGADEVVLIINNSSSCGLAWLMTTVSTSFASKAFAVVHHSCATGYYSFAHEIGHNMGARHDRFQDSTDTAALPTGHGFLNFAQSWRTIMAYTNSQCAGGSCTRIQYWSNPDVTAPSPYSGPTGIGVGGFTGTYTTTGLTINLAQSGSTLSGTFTTGTISGNMSGFVASSGQAYVWAWWNNTSIGSGVLAGSLTLSGAGATFNFGGGQSTGGVIGQTNLSGMALLGALSGSTTPSTSGGTASYAGTYSQTGLTIVLSQSGSTLTGTFTAGTLTGSLGGFVDSTGQAYVWAWYDTGAASAALAGKLTLVLPTPHISGSSGTFSFGGGQSATGIVGPILLSGMTKQ